MKKKTLSVAILSMTFRVVIFAAVLLISILPWWSAIPRVSGAPDWDVFVDIDDLVVNKCMDLLSDSDVYVEIQITGPEKPPPYATYILTNTVTVPVGAKPHVGLRFPFPHHIPTRIEWWVYDEDFWWAPDQIMTSGNEVITSLPHTAKSGWGPPRDAASINLTVSAKPNECGKNLNSAKRVMPSTVSPGQTFNVQLNLDVNETLLPTTVNVIEQFSTPFTFVGADLAPTSISHITDSEGLNITQLEWTFSGADVVDKTIVYNVIAPNTEGTTQFGGITVFDIGTNVIHGISGITVVSPGVGGIVIPVDKFALLAPYIGLASTILVATVATAVYVKRVKHRKEKQ